MRGQNNVEKKALYEVIADKLEEMILGDQTKFQQKLPSEQRLAESFSVSRPVIREALKILKERGLIDSKQGAASVIVEYSNENLSKAFFRLTQSKNVSVEQIHQVRTALELLSVRLAALNATKEDVRALKKLIALFEKQNQPIALCALDIKFHKKIVQISKNPLLEDIYSSLMYLIESVINTATSFETKMDGIYWHKKIIAAIADKDAEKAVNAMQQHLLLSIRNIEVFSSK